MLFCERCHFKGSFLRGSTQRSIITWFQGLVMQEQDTGRFWFFLSYTRGSSLWQLPSFWLLTSNVWLSVAWRCISQFSPSWSHGAFSLLLSVSKFTFNMKMCACYIGSSLILFCNDVIITHLIESAEILLPNKVIFWRISV